jgi:hypothetical protein
MTERLSVLFLFMFMFASLLSAGELAEKAARFDQIMMQKHIPRGLVVNLQAKDENGQTRYRSHGDSTIWTGAYIVSQAFRFRVTSDVEALNNMEKCLRALVTLHEMSGGHGFIGRAYGTREEMGEADDIVAGVGSYSSLVFRADTSRDQYTGILMGCGIAWPLIRDQELRQRVR